MQFIQYLLNSLTHNDAAIEACSVEEFKMMSCVTGPRHVAGRCAVPAVSSMLMFLTLSGTNTPHILSQFRQIYLTATENQFMWIKRQWHMQRKNPQRYAETVHFVADFVLIHAVSWQQ